MKSKDLQMMQSGERTNAAGKPVGNVILLSIPDSDYSSLRPHLQYVKLPSHLVLHEAGGKLNRICVFPESRFDFSCSHNERWKNRRSGCGWK